MLNVKVFAIFHVVIGIWPESCKQISSSYRNTELEMRKTIPPNMCKAQEASEHIATSPPFIHSLIHE